ncbi:MAG: AraC family transcriptional regulator [Cyclobacteriaceae bacterium]
MSVEIIELEKGEYLAPNYQTSVFGDLLVSVTQYQAEVPTGKWHAHQNPMFSFVLYGGNIECRNSKTIERAAGSLNFYHAFEPHQNLYKSFPSKHISVEVESDFMLRHGLEECDLLIDEEAGGNSSFGFIKILKEATINDLDTSSSIESLFLDLIGAKRFENRFRSSPRWVNDLRDLLNDIWNTNVSLQQLSEVVGVHPITISKNFRKYFHYTLGEYMRRLKIMRALELMHFHEIPLTEVALRCGFSDQSHFIRVFKNMTGFGPMEYRRLKNF